MSYLRNIFLFLISMLWFGVHAQTDRQLIRSGNHHFRQQNYVKAEIEYRKALVQNGNNSQALYNLGTVLLMQQKDSAATIYLERAGKAEKSSLIRSKIIRKMSMGKKIIKKIRISKNKMIRKKSNHRRSQQIA